MGHESPSHPGLSIQIANPPDWLDLNAGAQEKTLFM
jgi:hypothetical protein